MKTNFKELQVGQKLITRMNPKKGYVNIYNSPRTTYHRALLLFWIGRPANKCIADNVVITVVKIVDSLNITVRLDNDSQIVSDYLDNLYIEKKGTEFRFRMSDLKSATVEYSDILPHEDIIQYRIFSNNKLYDKKYFDTIEKVKNFLSIRFKYFSHSEYAQFVNDNIEASFEYYKYKSTLYVIDEKIASTLKVVRYTNKKNPIEIEFNILDFFISCQKISTVLYNYGFAVKSAYETLLSDNASFSHILIYESSEYRDMNHKRLFWGYYTLPQSESERIRDILCDLNIKDIKRITKNGKTAILINDLDILIKLISKLDNSEFIVLNNIKGDLMKSNLRDVKLNLLEIF